MATNENGNLIDSGRTQADGTVIDQNVVVDFVWGNFPLQPNDDREEKERKEFSDRAIER